MRTEKDVFSDLETLCSAPGYAHALAYLCFRDNFIKIGEEFTPQDYMSMNSPERLCRTEFSVLVGLMVKGRSYLDPINLATLSKMIERSDELLAELHKTMNQAFRPVFMEAMAQGSDLNPFMSGIAQRESIFYSGESAFDFQFRDFALNKYLSDNEWFLANKGYSIQDAVQCLEAISTFQNQNIVDSLAVMQLTPMEDRSLLPAFMISTDCIAEQSGLNKNIVSLFLNSLSCPAGLNNAEFNSIDDFNYINAYPLIKVSEENYICFQEYGVAQAFYETPFFWMNADRNYKNQASLNRGQFTERISKSRLSTVFGDDRVFENVLIREKGKKEIVGEIDVLVLFGDRAIVLQAKSKKLTLQARKGDELALSKDFKQSVQESYDQGLLCTKYLLNDKYELIDKNGKKLTPIYKITEVYIACVVSDHYPGLNFQARTFLKYEDTEEITPPLVTDVFFLDVFCEMLQNPLLFISYLNRRLRYFEQVMSSNEFAILGYHLRRNLWIQSDKQIIVLDDDVSTDLDIAIISRRSGLPGATTPPGLLTKVVDENLPLGKILKEINDKELPSIIEFGLLVFTFSEETIKQLNRGIKQISTLAKNDGRQHDFTIAIADTGITIHCNDAPIAEASRHLRGHCELRKYALKSKKWFGILLSSAPELNIRNGLKVEYEYEYSEGMEKKLATMPKAPILKDGKIYDFSGLPRKKLGRNDPCPCGSGLKFKKCCND